MASAIHQHGSDTGIHTSPRSSRPPPPAPLVVTEPRSEFLSHSGFPPSIARVLVRVTADSHHLLHTCQCVSQWIPTIYCTRVSACQFSFKTLLNCTLLLLSCWVVSDALPHGLQPSRDRDQALLHRQAGFFTIRPPGTLLNCTLIHSSIQHPGLEDTAFCSLEVYFSFTLHHQGQTQAILVGL